MLIRAKYFIFKVFRLLKKQRDTYIYVGVDQLEFLQQRLLKSSIKRDCFSVLLIVFF